MDVQTEIRAWLLKQQDWLQETAERLLEQVHLAPADYNALIALIKSPEGQAVTNHRTFAGLMRDPDEASVLRLTRVENITGIENLGPRLPLDFGTGNLIVIYGHNGSGKSSYTRILKKISGKPRAMELRSNVFQVPPVESKCQISFHHNGAPSTSEWHAGSGPIEALRHVDIFDTDEASHYLRAESTATYTPPVVRLFENLAAATDRIKELLTDEQAKLVKTLPVLPAPYQQTEAGRSYAALQGLADAAIERLLEWKEEHSQSLEALIDRLKVEDPAASAKQKRGTKTQVEQIISSVLHASKAYSAENVEAIRSLRINAAAKRKIALEAAQIQTAVLEGVGTPTWRALWEAAREYSTIPYPDSPFPVTVGARCVLCQQDLSDAAQQRLVDFERFVQGKLEVDAQTAEKNYKDALGQLPLAPSEQQLQTQCEAGGLVDPRWKEYLSEFWIKAAASRLSLYSEELIEAAMPVKDMSGAMNALSKYRDDLETLAAQFDKDALEFDRVKANGERQAFEAKKWVAQQGLAVRDEIKRLRSVKSYDDWKALASSRQISMKATQISEKVVTDAYVARFNRELDALGAKKIQIELVKTRTKSARVLHQLRLKGVKNGQSSPESVLSEGERRIISLAAFLADVADKPGSAPFVFDDPISSLDHDFEWHVACRLAELAKQRQVLIFTHRLSLYGTMEDVAKKAGEDWKTAHYRPMCIEAYGGMTGHPADQETWNTNTKKANNILLTRLDSAKKAGEIDGAAAYRALAQSICSDFRKLLERSVEEDLLNKIVLRHRRSVTTNNLLPSLQGMLIEELKVIDDLMTKYSCFEHSQSSELPVVIPEELELKADIEVLKKWRGDLGERRKTLGGW